MDRLHLKCALMDLMEHDLVIVESKEDAAVVVKAAQKLGYETSADHRSSEQVNGTSWVITTTRLRDTPVEGHQGTRSPEPSQVSVEVGG